MTSLYILQAAAHAASVFGNDVVLQDVADTSYRTVVTGGLYRTPALRRGQEVLEKAQLLRNVDGSLYATQTLLSLNKMPIQDAVELIYRALILVEQPLWLWGLLDDGGLHWENVPDAAQSVISGMLSTPEEREAYLLGLARTVDAERLTELGSRGEEFAVKACSEHLVDRGRADLVRFVCRVSTVSDQLGYDLTAIDTGGVRHRVEVKTSSVGVDRFEFYLSRNEADFAERDPNWSMVAVCLDGNDRVLGWCRAAALIPHLPVDVTSEARWASVRITLPLTKLTPGLPLDAS
ncbi:DUF3883 domain-containing protein [Microbacterium hydrocarbonoxydans]|uniref:DUF3883 domain-containing protein n=1 Tax=Microbacterium hydrocarbonoxydans TaxID=273678 RepID=UPI003D991D73